MLLGPGDLRGLLRGAGGDARRGGRRAAGQRGAHPARHPRASTCGPACTTSSTALGVARIGGDPRCTLEYDDLYSHRGDGRTGRQAAITWLRPAA